MPIALYFWTSTPKGPPSPVRWLSIAACPIRALPVGLTSGTAGFRVGSNWMQVSEPTNGSSGVGGTAVPTLLACRIQSAPPQLLLVVQDLIGLLEHVPGFEIGRGESPSLASQASGCSGVIRMSKSISFHPGSQEPVIAPTTQSSGLRQPV